jgi:hypothetical protein
MLTTSNTKLTLADIRELALIALPSNIAPIERQNDIPGPKIIMPVDTWEDAIAEAGGRDCGVMRSTIDGGLYLIIPVSITPVSVVHTNDVINVAPAGEQS